MIVTAQRRCQSGGACARQVFRPPARCNMPAPWIRRFIQLCVLLGLVLIHRPVAAQTDMLQVRGGEHASFTRIVIPLPERVGWTLEQNRRLATLTLESPDAGYDLSQAFARIPRTRLLDLKATGPVLGLFLACDCGIDVIEDASGFLIIDIRAQSDTPRPVPSAAQLEPRHEDTAPAQAAQAAGIALAKRLRADDWGPTIPKSALPIRPAPMPLGQIPDAGAPDLDPSLQRNADIRTRFLQTLTEAGQNSGILDLPAAMSAIDGQLPEQSEVFAPLDRASILDHLRVPGLLQDDPDVLPLTGRHHCPPSNLWSSGVGQYGTAPLQVAGLYDDLDRVQSDHVLQEARRLLASGLGAETRQILALLRDTPEASMPESDWLRRLSYLVDLDNAPAPEIWPTSRDCGPVALLWQFLEQPENSDLHGEQARTLTVALADFPIDLRLHLGARLLRHMVLADASESVMTLSRMLRRVAPKAGRMDALLAISEPGASLTARTWAGFLDRIHIQKSVDDLLLSLHRASAEAGFLLPALQHAADDWLAFHPNDPDRAVVQKLLALAQARSERFDMALATEHSMEQERTEPVRQGLRSELSLLALQHPDDAVFLGTIFKLALWDDAPDGIAPREQLAQRLEILGFPEQAQQMRNIPSPDSAAKGLGARVQPARLDGSGLPDNARPDPGQGRLVDMAMVSATMQVPRQDDAQDASPGPGDIVQMAAPDPVSPDPATLVVARTELVQTTPLLAPQRSLRPLARPAGVSANLSTAFQPLSESRAVPAALTPTDPAANINQTASQPQPEPRSDRMGIGEGQQIPRPQLRAAMPDQFWTFATATDRTAIRPSRDAERENNVSPGETLLNEVSALDRSTNGAGAQGQSESVPAAILAAETELREGPQTRSLPGQQSDQIDLVETPHRVFPASGNRGPARAASEAAIATASAESADRQASDMQPDGNGALSEPAQTNSGAFSGAETALAAPAGETMSERPEAVPLVTASQEDAQTGLLARGRALLDASAQLREMTSGLLAP